MAVTSDLPDGNRTTDAHIAKQADAEDRVVVTKDRDFRDSHLLTGSPRRLLVIATGNITNNALLALFEKHLDAIAATLTEADFVELGPGSLVVHKRRKENPRADRHERVNSPVSNSQWTAEPRLNHLPQPTLVGAGRDMAAGRHRASLLMSPTRGRFSARDARRQSPSR
ncbi:MAG: DUF5615 family PIN-like protein [Pseudonocardiaceae bacterium]